MVIDHLRVRPLCGAGVVFEGAVDGRELDIGVSGLLSDNDMLHYDRQAELLWSQLKHQAGLRSAGQARPAAGRAHHLGGLAVMLPPGRRR